MRSRIEIHDSIADSEEPEQTRTSEDALMSFVFRAVDEVGATLNTALVVLGDKLGYYRAMTGGPVTAAQLAESCLLYTSPSPRD